MNNKTIRTNMGNVIEYTVDGRLHREDGPAVIYDNGDIAWYKNGKIHRENGPAVIWNDGLLVWYKDGKKHREDGPAMISFDGILTWYKDGDFVKRETNQNKKLERD